VVLGFVAAGAGLVTVLTGGASVLGGPDVAASLDSELRFYAAWYVGLGVLLLRAAPRVESETTVIRAVCAVLLLAAAGRVISWVTVGSPHPFYQGLLVVELGLPVLLVPWQSAVARSSATTGPGADVVRSGGSSSQAV
jgi:hypothetical protein